MVRRSKPYKKKEYEEQLVQKFPRCCPYCNQPISYDPVDLNAGENKIQCPSCKKTYIRVVSDPTRNDLVREISLPRREVRKMGKIKGK